MGTELELAVKRGKDVLKKTDSLNKVAEAMAAVDTPLSDESVEFPALPEPRELSSAVRQAMSMLPDCYGAVNPTDRRTLSEDELTDLYREHEYLREAGAAIASRAKDIREIVLTHMDVRAEVENRAVPRSVVRGGKTIVPATPRDKDGHYLLATPQNPEQVKVPGTGKAYSAEYRNGKVTVNADDMLLALHEADKISRSEYLAFTREVRVLDERGATDFINDSPERGLEILRDITSHVAPGMNLNVRKA
jgi:hypothetical protein